MVGECGQALASCQVPQPDGRVVAGSDDLRVRRLGENTGDCVSVSSESVDIDLGPHVPDPGTAVPATGDQHVQRGVECQVVHSRQMPVVVPDHLVVLKVPALNLDKIGSDQVQEEM